MSFLPSTADCLRRLERLADTPQVRAELADFYATVTARGDEWPEHAAAIKRLDELHTLAQHLAANLRSGGGVPPTPVMASKARPVAQRAAIKPVKASDDIGAWRVPTSSSPPAAATDPALAVGRGNREGRARTPAPAGMIDVGEFSALLGISRGRFYSLRAKGELPPAAVGGGFGNPTFWARDVAAAFATSRPAAGSPPTHQG